MLRTDKLIGVAAIAAAISFISYEAPAQSREDSDWVRAESCAAIDTFVRIYPSTRFRTQIGARRLALGCISSASPPASAQLRSQNPALQWPIPSLTMARQIDVSGTPCVGGAQCALRIVGVDIAGQRFGVVREQGIDDAAAAPVIWNGETGARLTQFRLPPGIEDGSNEEAQGMAPIGVVHFLSSDAWVVSQGFREGFSYPWTLSTGQPGRWGLPQRLIIFSGDRRRSSAGMSGSGGCIVNIYDERMQILHTIPDTDFNYCHASPINLSRNGDRLAMRFQNDARSDEGSAGAQTFVQVWDTQAGTLLRSVAGDTGALSPDGSLLAVWFDKNAEQNRQSAAGRVTTIATGRQGPVMRAHDGSISSLSFSPDGSLLASGGSDGLVNMWHVASGQLLGSYGGFPEPVCSIRFTPRGRGLITQCESLVRVYDAGNGRMLGAFVKGRNNVRDVMVAPDATAIVVALSAADGSSPRIQIWRVQ